MPCAVVCSALIVEIDNASGWRATIEYSWPKMLFSRQPAAENFRFAGLVRDKGAVGDWSRELESHDRVM